MIKAGEFAAKSTGRKTAPGKLEKFNAYVDRSFEPEARRLKIQTLEELNQYFEVWLAENYNQKVPAEIRRTPLAAHQSEQDRMLKPLIIRANVWDGETEPAAPNQEKAAGELRTSFLKLLQERYEQKLKDKAHRIHYAKLYQKEDDAPHI